MKARIPDESEVDHSNLRLFVRNPQGNLTNALGKSSSIFSINVSFYNHKFYQIQL